MTVSQVFAKAWELWKRDVGWLILAGLVVGLIIGVMVVIVVAIVAGMAVHSIGGITIDSNGSVSGPTGLGAGTLVGALVVGLLGYLVVSLLAMIFYGGVFEMVIGAARQGRGVEFGDLFSGFRKFSSFLIFWLVIVGITIVCGLVAIIPIIGIIAAIVFLVWLEVTWLYVLPLIADRGMTFGEAASASRAMVRSTGFWKTFGVIIVLGLVFVAVGIVISVLGRASTAVSQILLIAFEIVAGPFAICYVSTMYLEAGGETAVAATPAGAAVPPAPPAPDAAAYPAPPAGGQTYLPASPPVSGPRPVLGGATGTSVTASLGVAGADAAAATRSAADAWKAAADPLAGATAPQTAVTDAVPAVETPAATPPEAPPAPPAPGS